MRGAVLLLGTAGCLTLPPPSHVHAMPAVAASRQSETGVDVGLAIVPALSISRSQVVQGAPWAVVDVRLQGGLNHASLTPGVWARSGAQLESGLHFGARLGVAAGFGDAFGVADLLEAPWLGPTVHLQLAGNAMGGTALALTLGSEYTFPLANPVGFDAANGVDVLMLPGFWNSLDGRAEFDLGEGTTRFAVGGGVALGMAIVISPHFDLGVRW